MSTLSLCLAFLAIVIALLLGLVVTRVAYRPRHTADLKTLRQEIERAEKQHAPRKHLRKQMVEAVRIELERTA